MKKSLENIMNKHDNIIYIAGHEHNLQYTKQNKIHHIISGAGSKTTHVKKNKKLVFGVHMKGFSKIDYYDNGQVWLNFLTINNEEEIELVFQKFLFHKEIMTRKAY